MCYTLCTCIPEVTEILACFLGGKLCWKKCLKAVVSFASAYIANRVTDKLTQLTDRVFCCRSGSAAATQAIADAVKYHLNFLSIEMGEQPLVKTVANVFREICYANRDQMTAGIICAGWDKREGGQVFSIPLGGMCVKQPFAIGGT